MDILYDFINNTIYKHLNREKCKNMRINVVSFLERVFTSMFKISKNNIGIGLRSVHITGPFVLLLLLIVSKYRLLCDTVVFILFLIPTLFILFDGCILSSLENRFINDGFNVIDPVLEMTSMEINKENRLKMNYVMCFNYLIIGIMIYAYRLYFTDGF